MAKDFFGFTREPQKTEILEAGAERDWTPEQLQFLQDTVKSMVTEKFNATRTINTATGAAIDVVGQELVIKVTPVNCAVRWTQEILINGEKLCSRL